MMALTLDALFASPDHYLHSFEGDAAIFVQMDRIAYHRSIFLDGRISPAGDGSMRLPLSALARDPEVPPPTSWIFHVAHCGSTLLARALDHPELNLVLREPLTLRQLALAPDSGRLALARAMVSKRYRPDLPTIVKANVPVNFLLPQIVESGGSDKAIFLHCGLRDYLLAILRNDNHRNWVRRVTTDLGPYLGDLSGSPDGERAAALWLAQMRAFCAAIGRMPEARSLDAEVFFAAPRPILALAAAHLGVPFDGAVLDAIVAGPLFATYSKNPELPFDNQARLTRKGEVEAKIGEELMQADRWIEAHGEEVYAALAVIAGCAINL